MILRSALAVMLTCTLSLGVSFARAADDSAAELPATVRPFGELSTWYGRVGADRVPIKQQPVREMGNRALMPPRSCRDGLEPRLAATLEYNDNVLLSSSNARQGNALIVMPGANWLHLGPRHRIQIDASVEALRSLSSGFEAQTFDAATVQVSAGARPSATTSADYTGTLLHSHDPAGETLVTTTPISTAGQRFATDYQRHEVAFGWRSGPVTEWGTRWIGTWARSADPSFVRTIGHDVELAARRRVAATQRVGVVLRERNVEFAARPPARYTSAWFELERQWSPTLLSKVAIAPARGTGGDQLLLWRVETTKTFRDGQWDATLEHDVNAAGGLGEIVEVYSARVGATWRVGQNSRLEVSMQGARYRARTGGDTTQTLRPRISLTVPLDTQWWFNLRYVGVDDQVRALDFERHGNRVMTTLMRTF